MIVFKEGRKYEQIIAYTGRWRRYEPGKSNIDIRKEQQLTEEHDKAEF